LHPLSNIKGGIRALARKEVQKTKGKQIVYDNLQRGWKETEGEDGMVFMPDLVDL